MASSVMPSSTLPSTALRRQLSCQLSSMASAGPLSSSFKSARAFSLLASPQRRTQTLPQQNKHISSPSPKSFQQTRTFLAKLTRTFPGPTQTTRKQAEEGQATQVVQRPSLQLTNLPYFVRRTPSNQFPVYLVTKAGGTKRLTKIQKTEGDLEALKSDLAIALGLETSPSAPTRGSRPKKTPDITINPTNGHIIVKGWRKPEIQKFLAERNF